MNNNIPMAERLRPMSLDDYIGQKHFSGRKRHYPENDRFRTHQLIYFMGPSGSWQDYPRKIIARTTEASFFTLSAVTSGVKDVREVFDRCKSEASSMFSTVRPILFIDEIHRFNKSQQDSLLGAVEQGVVTLIGATTENPSFEVIRPLLSRAQVYTLKPLDTEDLDTLLSRAINADPILKGRKVEVREKSALFRFQAAMPANFSTYST